MPREPTTVPVRNNGDSRECEDEERSTILNAGDGHGESRQGAESTFEQTRVVAVVAIEGVAVIAFLAGI